MMDTTNGSYMQYHNSNDDALSQFLNGVHDYADISNDTETQFDPALFAENGLASFSQQQTQPSQPAHSNFNHVQHRTQSQSPALPQFKQSQNAYSPQQYGQHVYNQQSMGQSFDPQLLARPTPSPGPFDQYAYQSNQAGYGQPNFNYSFNSFQQQQQSSTPSQAFRPQVNQQTQHYMNTSRPSSIPPAHISQVQNQNVMPYPYQPGNTMHNRFVEPSMLNSDGQLHHNLSQMPQPRQMEASTYFTKAGVGPGAGATLDPRALGMQPYPQPQQHNQVPTNNAHHASGVPMLPHIQSVAQFPLQNAPQARGGNAKLPTKKASKTSGSASDSDDSLEIEDEEPPETKPAIITIARPTDEKAKIVWDVVDAVWTPKNRPAPAEKIRAAVKFIGETLRNLRDKWKESNDRLKKAENANQPVDELRAVVGAYRDLMEKLAARITQFGHPSILKRLGENLILLSALYSFLLDRVNAEDYDSTLVATILQLGTRLETVDEEQLEKVKWTKILVSRFAKKSTNQSKVYAQQIVANAKKATARKKIEATGQGPASPSGSTSGQVVGVKRPREGSETIQQVKKAAVKPSSKPLSVQLAEQRKQKEKEKIAAGKDVKVTTNGAAVVARPKTTTIVPTKTSQFASLLSASKRPGTTNAERDRLAKERVDILRSVPVITGALKREPAVKVELSSAKPAATSSTSFLGFLADMEKPKEAPQRKVEEDPNESPEARALRLRKESRKRLRVSWKPESELVQTRIFEHDPDEETGHEDNQMRDVGDTGKEGEMLKHRHQVEDEEESDSDDEPVVEYLAPSEIDFSSMKEKPEDDFDNQNFVKCGGNLKPESPGSEAQTKHEDGVAMAIWAAGEQPDTPKEPPEADDDDDFNPVIDFGEPVEDRVRRREQRVLASRQPYQQPDQSQASGFDLAAALSQMQPQPHQTQQQQTQWLQALGLLNQQQQHPQAVTQHAQPAQQLDLSAILAAAQQYQAQQQPQPAYQAPALAGAPPLPVPNVSALLGQLAGGISQTGQQSYGAPVPLPVGSDDNPNPFPGKLDKKDKNKKRGGKNHGHGGVPVDSNGLPYNYKTKICQFWLENSCTKGDACTYRHDQEGMDIS